MNIAKERKAIDDALAIYRARLDAIPEEQFTETPRGGGWSYAEVYSHILQATLGSFIGLERSANDNCPPTKKGLNFVGRMVMLTGSFPVRLKVPQAVAVRMPAVKMSKEDAKNLLVKCRRRIDDIMPVLKDPPPNSRYKHPRLGMLNARQWFKFIRIHAQHHIKQLDRIEKKLKKG